MAIIKDNLLVGVLGPLIFKIVNGKQIVTTKAAPGTMKQTASTIWTGKTFGLCSIISSHILQTYKRNFKNLQDGSMFGRLTPILYSSIVAGWDQEDRLFHFDEMDFSPLIDFDYNIKSPLKASLGVEIDVQQDGGKLLVSFTQLANRNVVHFPKGATSCEMTVALALFKLDEGLRTSTTISQSQMIKKFSNQLEMDKFQFDIPGGCVCLVSTFLHFYSYTKNYAVSVNTKKFNPAAISAALMIPNSVSPNSDYKWVEMPGLKFK
jgi:hypothetical protein